MVDRDRDQSRALAREGEAEQPPFPIAAVILEGFMLLKSVDRRLRPLKTGAIEHSDKNFLFCEMHCTPYSSDASLPITFTNFSP